MLDDKFMKYADKPEFIAEMDKIVDNAKNDPELKEALAWLEKEAFKNNRTFYQESLVLAYNFRLQQEAKKWLEKQHKEE